MPTPAHASITAPAPPGHGLPPEHLDRIAARRAFVAAKQCFSRCVETLDTTAPLGAWLAQAVRRAQDPEDLWLLRSGLFAALRRQRASSHGEPHDSASPRPLRQALDTLFPSRFEPSGFGGAFE